MNNNSNKFSVFYGRARRLELYEKIAYILVGVVAVVLVFIIVTKQSDNSDKNVNYSYLKQYFYDRGFSCDLVHKSGGKCRKDTPSVSYVFTRYDDGFEYFISTESYSLLISHTLQKENTIVFTTTSEAFTGYKNNEYKCELGKNVLEPVKDCKTKEGQVLNLNSYLGIIEQAQNEVNNVITSSGYYKSSLLEEYQWQKK